MQAKSARPFVVPRREYPWMRVRYLQLIVVVALVLFIGRTGGLIFTLALPERWKVAISLILLFFAVFLAVREKVTFLLAVMVIFVTWRQGAFYNWYFESDLILFSDFPMLLLLLMLPIYRKQRVKFRLPLYVGLIYSVWYLTGIAAGAPPGPVFADFFEQARAWLMLMLIAKFVQTERNLRQLLNAFLLLLLTQGAICMYTWKFGALPLFGGFFAGGSDIRTTGSFGHPNTLGAFLTLLLPLAFRYVAMVAHPRWVWFFALSLLTGMFALYASFSRAAWFGTAAAVICMLGWDLINRQFRFKRYKIVVCVAGLALTALFIKYPGLIMNRLSGAADEFDASNKYSRMWYWMEALPIIAAHPVFGTGAGNYANMTAEGTRVHNTYLYIAASTGLPGLAFFLLFIGVTYYSLYLAWWYGNLYVKEVALGIGFGLFGFLVSAIAGPDYCLAPQMRHTVWLVCGLSVALLNMVSVPLPERQRRRSMPAWNIARRYARGVPHTIPLDMRKRYPQAVEQRPASEPDRP